MKKIFILIFLLCSSNVFSQTSFKVQVDTSIKIRDAREKIVSCVDGGIAIAAINKSTNNFNTIMYKCNSNGTYEWSNYYNIDMDDFGSASNMIQLKATNDSGFYLLSHARHDMFGWFDTPTLQKVNKDGIVTGALRLTDNSAGNNLHISAVEKFNNNIYGLGSSSEYDPFDDVVCCYDSYSFKLDSSLGLLKRLGYNWLFYDTLDVPFAAQNKYDTNYVWKGFELYDTSGYHFSTIQYYNDSYQVDNLSPYLSCQDNDNFYFFDFATNYPLRRACIHKVDKNFNTIFSIVIDTTNNLPSANMWGEIAMDKSANGNLLISCILYLANYKYHPFMMELDTAGNVIHAWRGDGTDSLYFTSAIDTISESFLFGSRNNNGWVSPLKIERQFPSSPTCGFIPVTVNTFPISIVDSFFVASDTLIAGVNPLCIYNPTPEIYLPAGPGYPLCGVLSGNIELNHPGNCNPTIFPNPANDKLNITFNCEINQTAEVKIFNIIGEEVFSKSISTSNYETIFDVSKLPAGIYLVKSQSAGQAVSNSKIVIQK